MKSVAEVLVVGAGIVPTIRGQAHISAEATLIIQPDDPFGWGLP